MNAAADIGKSASQTGSMQYNAMSVYTINVVESFKFICVLLKLNRSSQLFLSTCGILEVQWKIGERVVFQELLGSI